MSRRTRWILLALIVVLVGGAIALVVVEQPKLDDARTAVDERWRPLRAPEQLALRYQTLEGALSAFDAAGGSDRAVSKDLRAALTAWKRALRDGDAGSQAVAANTLEAQASRLLANVSGSERLKLDQAVTSALTRFATTKPDDALVAAYNRAVRAYEDERTGTLQQPVARILGYDARPVLLLAAGFGPIPG
jgi:hypothetical protein